MKKHMLFAALICLGLANCGPKSTKEVTVVQNEAAEEQYETEALNSKVAKF